MSMHIVITVKNNSVLINHNLMNFISTQNASHIFYFIKLHFFQYNNV